MTTELDDPELETTEDEDEALLLVDDLTAEATQTERRIDALVAAFILALALFLRRVVTRHLTTAVEDADTGSRSVRSGGVSVRTEQSEEAVIRGQAGLVSKPLTGGGSLSGTGRVFPSPSGVVTLTQAASVIASLNGVVREAGLPQQLNRLREIFQNEYEAVSKEFQRTTGKKAPLNREVRKNLERLAEIRVASVNKRVESYLEQVKSVVVESAVAKQPVRPIQAVDAAEAQALRPAQREVREAVSNFRQVTHNAKAEKAGVKRYVYIGPDDAITRPFCRKRIDQVFTREEIDRMRNGQIEPVFIHCGGYNCRHHWRPVSERLAKQIEEERADSKAGEISANDNLEPDAR